MRNSPSLSQDGNTVYVGDDTRGGSNGANLYAIDVDTARVRWCYDTKIGPAAPNGQLCTNPPAERPPCCTQLLSIAR
jgi:hypothetical protein